jgi:hypothetical protein
MDPPPPQIPSSKAESRKEDFKMFKDQYPPGGSSVASNHSKNVDSPPHQVMKKMDQIPKNVVDSVVEAPILPYNFMIGNRVYYIWYKVDGGGGKKFLWTFTLEKKVAVIKIDLPIPMPSDFSGFEELNGTIISLPEEKRSMEWRVLAPKDMEFSLEKGTVSKMEIESMFGFSANLSIMQNSLTL